MRRRGATVLAALGLATISVGAVRASVDDDTFTVEVLPVPGGSGFDVAALSADQAGTGKKLAESAVADLTKRYPELAGIVMSEPTPVYDENLSDPTGVSVRLDLPKAVDVTMDLVRTIIDDSGELVAQAQPSEITNLRGLVMDLSLESGQIEALYPAPYAGDVNRSDEATQVRVLDGEQYRVYPAGDPRGDEE